MKGRNPVALSNSTPWTLPVRTAGLKGGTALSPGPSSLVQRIRRGIAGKLRPTIRSGISPPQPLTDPGFRERKSRRSPSTHLPIRWEGRPGLSRRRSQGTISGRQVAWNRGKKRIGRKTVHVNHRDEKLQEPIARERGIQSSSLGIAVSCSSPLCERENAPDTKVAPRAHPRDSPTGSSCMQCSKEQVNPAIGHISGGGVYGAWTASLNASFSDGEW